MYVCACVCVHVACVCACGMCVFMCVCMCVCACVHVLQVCIQTIKAGMITHACTLGVGRDHVRWFTGDN